MHSDVAISVKNLTKTYRIFGHPGDRIKQALTFGQKQYHKEFTALKEVSFEIKKGETVGIIGRNGSGKSTLLQLICGILKPTSGSVDVNGRISALLELGAGFNPEFTGRENVYFQGAVMGFTQAQMDVRFDDIAAFADIGEFIDQPVRTYSSGMFVRLAFAISINVSPDVLVVDEALAVGDTAFQVKCMNRMQQIASSGVTMLFVSHNSYQVQRMCDRVLYLDHGHIHMDGSPFDVIEHYEREIFSTTQVARQLSHQPQLFNFIDVECVPDITPFDAEKLTVAEGESFTLTVRYELNVPLPRGCQIGVLLKSADGARVFGEMSGISDLRLPSERGTHSVRIRFTPNLLLAGSYTFSFSAFDDDYIEEYGFWEHAITMRVSSPQVSCLHRVGLVELPHAWYTG
jgi:ABC-type polysaccharide/polyol phosphate transport system ATPase subunit